MRLSRQDRVLLVRAQLAQTAATDAQTAADAAQAAADTGVGDAATAQTTADTALDVATDANTKAISAEQQAEALAAAAGQVNTPSYSFDGSPLSVLLECSTDGSAIEYRINGGSWNPYTGAVGLSPGDTLEAKATKGGLTDSGVMTYEA